MAAWLGQILEAQRASVMIWTAGVDVSDVGADITPTALEAARVMNLNATKILALERHRAARLQDQTTSTNFMVWLTDKNKMTMPVANETRLRVLQKTAARLGATLMIIPEADDAFEVAQKNPGAKEKIAAAYLEQALRLRGWAEIVATVVR
jgi:hypothetical protein